MDLSFLDQLLGESTEEIEDFQNVWVVAIAWSDALRPCDIQLTGKARELADSLGAYVNILLIGEGADESLAQEMIASGADAVHVAAGYPTGQALVNFVEQYKPELLLFSDAAGGRKMAPRLAQRIDAALVSHAVDLSINTESRTLLAATPIYRGAAFQVIECLSKPQIATVRPGVFPTPYRDDRRSGDVHTIDLTTKPQPPLAPVEPPAQTIPLKKADIIIAGGRGLADAGWQLIDELAAAFASAMPQRRITTAGSRGAFDEGWIERERMVDMTAATVAPELYLACGIRGTFQHFGATERAGAVVAINRNPDAPIFKHADYGIVGDVAEVIPALIAEIHNE